MECNFIDGDGCLHFYFTTGEGGPIHAENERGEQKSNLPDQQNSIFSLLLASFTFFPAGSWPFLFSHRLPPLTLLFHDSVWRFAHPSVGCHSDCARGDIARWLHVTGHCQNNTLCSGEIRSNLILFSCMTSCNLVNSYMYTSYGERNCMHEIKHLLWNRKCCT